MKLLLFSSLAVGAILHLCAFRYMGFPFSGPGYDPKEGVTIPVSDGKVVVAVTTGLIERGKGAAFFEHLNRVISSMPGNEGLVGWSARKELLGRTVWTQSVWTNEEALDGFLRSPAHREAARSGGIPRSSVRYAIAEVSPDEIPLSWGRAAELLEKDNH